MHFKTIYIRFALVNLSLKTYYAWIAAEYLNAAQLK